VVRVVAVVAARVEVEEAEVRVEVVQVVVASVAGG
jgi:hypothetical protein